MDKFEKETVGPLGTAMFTETVDSRRLLEVIEMLVSRSNVKNLRLVTKDNVTVTFRVKP